MPGDELLPEEVEGMLQNLYKVHKWEHLFCPFCDARHWNRSGPDKYGTDMDDDNCHKEGLHYVKHLSMKRVLVMEPVPSTAGGRRREWWRWRERWRWIVMDLVPPAAGRGEGGGMPNKLHNYSLSNYMLPMTACRRAAARGRCIIWWGPGRIRTPRRRW